MSPAISNPTGGLLLSTVKTEIFDLFSRAEQTIKLVENLGEGLTFPAVNQLRYAGQHLLKSDCADNENSKEEHLKKAKYHCQRAIYDASEIGVIHYLEEIRIFQDDYKQVVVTDIVLNYSDTLKKAKKAREFILKNHNKKANNESNEDINKMDSEYEECAKLLKELEEFVDSLTIMRPELNKKIELNRRIAFIAVVGLILAILGLIVAII